MLGRTLPHSFFNFCFSSSGFSASTTALLNTIFKNKITDRVHEPSTGLLIPPTVINKIYFGELVITISSNHTYRVASSFPTSHVTSYTGYQILSSSLYWTKLDLSLPSSPTGANTDEKPSLASYIFSTYFCYSFRARCFQPIRSEKALFSRF